MRRTVPHYLSLGAGVQSSTLALMAAAREVPGYPMPAGAIFADTQAEPQNVYDWLGWLEEQLPFPVYRVTNGDLDAESRIIKRSQRTQRLYVREVVPAFLRMEDGKSSMLWRRCSRDYKIRPILRKLREKVRLPKKWSGTGLHAKSWIGISTDEVTRMKPSRDAWVENVWPLIDMGVSREDCKRWMADHGYPEPPRSACYFCPYHSNHEWSRLKRESPEDFEKAAKWEDALQEACQVDERYIGTPFAWRGLKPLREAAFGTSKNQGEFAFDEECEGICGV